MSGSHTKDHLYVYVLGNPNNPNGVVNRLITLGGTKVDNDISSIDLLNPVNAFYIDFHDNAIIKMMDTNTMMFESLKDIWIEMSPLTLNVDMPTSWKDAVEHYYEAQSYEDNDDNELVSSLETLGKLIVLRDIYRKGWIPSDNMPFYYIGCHGDKIDCMKGNAWVRLLSFQDASTRDVFLSTFKDMIEEVKEYI